MTKHQARVALLVLCAIAASCRGRVPVDTDGPNAPTDAGPRIDEGGDAGSMNVDAGDIEDAGGRVDAGSEDAGFDAGADDAGVDAGADDAGFDAGGEGEGEGESDCHVFEVEPHVPCGPDGECMFGRCGFDGCNGGVRGCVPTECGASRECESGVCASSGAWSPHDPDLCGAKCVQPATSGEVCGYVADIGLCPLQTIPCAPELRCVVVYDDGEMRRSECLDALQVGAGCWEDYACADGLRCRPRCDQLFEIGVGVCGSAGVDGASCFGGAACDDGVLALCGDGLLCAQTSAYTGGANLDVHCRPPSDVDGGCDPVVEQTAYARWLDEGCADGRVCDAATARCALPDEGD